MTLFLRRRVFGVPVYRWAALLILVLALVTLSVFIRGRLDLDWNVASLRGFVQSLGIWGPAAYIGILTFRFVFLIPTELLLVAAGILFGPVHGTIYAGLGMFFSGLVKYIAVVMIGRDALLNQLPDRLRHWVRSMAEKRMSAWALMGVCAYPFFPKHVFQFAALLSGMSLMVYVVSVLVGSTVRAALFATLGEAIFTGRGLILVTLILIVMIALPMTIRSWRRWVLAPFNSSHQRQAPKGRMS